MNPPAVRPRGDEEQMDDDDMYRNDEGHSGLLEATVVAAKSKVASAKMRAATMMKQEGLAASEGGTREINPTK